MEARIATNSVRGHESSLHLVSTGINQKITSKQTEERIVALLWGTATTLSEKTRKAISQSAKTLAQKTAYWTTGTKNYVLSDEMDWVGCISFILLATSAILLNIFI